MEQPISMYLDLEPGQTADLEVVARASLAFAATLKEVAYLIDPGIEVVIGFTSGTEGSLSLNTAIKTISKALPKDRTSLIAMALAAFVLFGHKATDYVIGKGFDYVLGADSLSDADVARIAAELDRIQKAKVAQQHVREVYQELKQDKAIKGVAVTPETPEAGKRPAQLIPRSEFEERSRVALPTTKNIQKRSTPERVRVTLVAPVLLPKARSWRLWTPALKEFGAKMKDEDFLKDLAEKKIKIPLEPGVQMDVVLTTNEENEGEVWTLVDRTIDKVIKTVKATRASTADLLSALEKHKADDD